MVSCEKDSCSKVVPEISFKSAVPSNINIQDSAKLLLTFKFKDCDGDIGLYSSDTSGVHDPDTGKYYYNLKIALLYFENNEWKRDTETFFDSRVPILNEDGAQLIEGEIDKELRSIELFYKDTFKLEATLIDRAFHESEPVETPVFSFN